MGHKLGEKMGRLVQLPGVALGIAGVFVFGSQCLWLIEDRVWFPKTLFDLWLDLGFTFHQSGSAAFQRVVLWVLDLPLSLALVVAGMALFWLGDRLRRMLAFDRRRGRTRSQ